MSGGHERIGLEEWKAAEKQKKQQWQDQVIQVKGLINEFVGMHDELRVEEGVNNGIRLLIHDAFTYASPLSPKAKIVEDLPVEELKNSLASILTEVLPDEPPKNAISMQKKNIGLLGGRPRKYEFTGPQNINMLLDRYGLVDGEVKTLEELAEKYNVPSWMPSVLLVSTLSLIRKNPTIQELVSQPKANP